MGGKSHDIANFAITLSFRRHPALTSWASNFRSTPRAVRPRQRKGKTNFLRYRRLSLLHARSQMCYVMVIACKTFPPEFIAPTYAPRSAQNYRRILTRLATRSPRACENIGRHIVPEQIDLLGGWTIKSATNKFRGEGERRDLASGFFTVGD